MWFDHHISYNTVIPNYGTAVFRVSFARSTVRFQLSDWPICSSPCMEISIITYSGGDSKIYRILLYYQNESSPTPGKIFRKGRLKIELKSPVIKIPFYYTMTSRNYIINTKLLIEHVRFQFRNVNKQLRSQGFRVRTRESRVFYVKFQEPYI